MQPLCTDHCVDESVCGKSLGRQGPVQDAPAPPAALGADLGPKPHQGLQECCLFTYECASVHDSAHTAVCGPLPGPNHKISEAVQGHS